MDWRIYYDDGSTFDSSQGTPEQAPGYGVIACVYPDAHVGRAVMSGWDFYYFVQGQTLPWWGSDLQGVLDQLCHDRQGAIRAVKQGRHAPTATYRQILDRVAQDEDFPRKSAKHRPGWEHPRKYAGHWIEP